MFFDGAYDQPLHGVFTVGHRYGTLRRLAGVRILHILKQVFIHGAEKQLLFSLSGKKQINPQRMETKESVPGGVRGHQ
jgi:hypothetical protein